jgi:thiosulfate dehydrogenase
LRRAAHPGVLAIAVAAVMANCLALAQDDGAPLLADRSPEWQLARGGRLYDNWFAAQLAEPPFTPHPMLPAGTGIEPATSWRCPTCHGWDYGGGRIAGADRVLDAPSLAGMRGADPAPVAATLKAGSHGYTDAILTGESLYLLARFVVEGQHDVATYADPDTGAANGDPLDGRPIYQGVCISCHDVDGLAYIEGEPGDLASLGWLARARPAQVLHKIRNGQPGTEMVQLRFLTDAQISDLLAYLQTLPEP